MGFFSDIIRDAHRASAAPIQDSREPAPLNSLEHPPGDPGNVVAEGGVSLKGGNVAAASSLPDAGGAVDGQYARQGGNVAATAPHPEAAPDARGAGVVGLLATAPGQSGNSAVAPGHEALAGLDSSASIAPHAAGGVQAGLRSAAWSLEKQIEPEPAELSSHALSDASASLRRPAPGNGLAAVPDPALSAEGGRAAQTRQQAAHAKQPEGAILKLALPEREDAGAGAAKGAPDLRAEIRAELPQEVADIPSPAPQNPAHADSVESRLVTPPPAAIDVSPVRRAEGGHDPASNTGPQVHIGHIDIVVLAPEPARPFQPASSASADLASRHYLRRL